MIVSERTGQIFVIVRKHAAEHYLVTGNYRNRDLELHHNVLCLESGEDMTLSEEYLRMADRLGWRDK